MSRTAIRIYWTLTALTLAGATLTAALYAPVDPEMGPVQKLIYLHLPAAVVTFLAAFAVFVGSVGFMWTREPAWDRFAAAAARTTLIFSCVVLITGMVWAKFFWGYWWTWSPRLTFTLVLAILYAGYFVVRWMIGPGQRRAFVSAVYGAIAFLDVPLVYLSVGLLPDVHPTSVPLTAEMRETLAIWFVLVVLVAIGMSAAPLLREAWRRAGTLETSGRTERGTQRPA
ncbi:MAG: cytochrome c biogenesis protein CcsA [Phycisphaerales bacterium]